MTIIILGSINMDLVCRVPRLPAPGETLTGWQWFATPGGKGANQAVAAARLGGRVAMIGRVGGDSFGTALRDSLTQAGVEASRVAVDAESSGTAVIMVDDAGQNSIVVIPGANGAVGPADLEGLERLLPDAALLLLQLEIPVATVVAAARLARRHQVPVMLDPAPAQAFTPDLYALTDILTPNETEASRLAGFPVRDQVTAAAAAAEFLTRGVRQVVIKLGAAGVYAHDGAHSRGLPGISVPVLDTTAAGDTFNGALAVALAERQTLSQALPWANAAAALSVTRSGAQISIPRRDEVVAFMQQRNLT